MMCNSPQPLGDAVLRQLSQAAARQHWREEDLDLPLLRRDEFCVEFLLPKMPLHGRCAGDGTSNAKPSAANVMSQIPDLRVKPEQMAWLNFHPSFKDAGHGCSMRRIAVVHRQKQRGRSTGSKVSECTARSFTPSDCLMTPRPNLSPGPPAAIDIDCRPL